MSSSDLKELESHMKINMAEFMKGDIPSALTSMIRMDHVPTSLISEIIKMNKLTTFMHESSYGLLREMI